MPDSNTAPERGPDEGVDGAAGSCSDIKTLDLTLLEQRVVALDSAREHKTLVDSMLVYGGATTGRRVDPSQYRWPHPLAVPPTDGMAQFRRYARADMVILDDIMDPMAPDLLEGVGCVTLRYFPTGRALVPVGPLRHVSVERFNTRALQDVLRPTDDEYLRQRVRNRETWGARMHSRLREHLDATPMESLSLHSLSRRSWMMRRECETTKEVDRVELLLVEQGVPPEDICVFYTGAYLAPRGELRRDIYLVYGLGANDYRLIRNQYAT